MCFRSGSRANVFSKSPVDRASDGERMVIGAGAGLPNFQGRVDLHEIDLTSLIDLDSSIEFSDTKHGQPRSDGFFKLSVDRDGTHQR